VNDFPVFTESDSSFCVDITSTKDGKFITVNSNSRTSSEERPYMSSIMIHTKKLFSSDMFILMLITGLCYRFRQSNGWFTKTM
jgi:protease II